MFEICHGEGRLGKSLFWPSVFFLSLTYMIYVQGEARRRNDATLFLQTLLRSSKSLLEPRRRAGNLMETEVHTQHIYLLYSVRHILMKATLKICMYKLVIFCYTYFFWKLLILKKHRVWKNTHILGRMYPVTKLCWKFVRKVRSQDEPCPAVPMWIVCGYRF